jgi:hypothetical protein
LVRYRMTTGLPTSSTLVTDLETRKTCAMAGRLICSEIAALEVYFLSKLTHLKLSHLGG